MWWMSLEVFVEPLWWRRTSRHVGTMKKRDSYLVKDDTE